jgi:hypothetical protein
MAITNQAEADAYIKASQENKILSEQYYNAFKQTVTNSNAQYEIIKSQINAVKADTALSETESLNKQLELRKTLAETLSASIADSKTYFMQMNDLSSAGYGQTDNRSVYLKAMADNLKLQQAAIDSNDKNIATLETKINELGKTQSAKDEEAAKAETAKNTPPPPVNVAEPTKASPGVADGEKNGDNTSTTSSATPTTNSGSTTAGKAGLSNVNANATSKIIGKRDYNPLTMYSSYTYNISLYLFDSALYNQYMNGDKSVLKDMKILIRSGGTNAKKDKITSGFENDLYIDDVVIKTMISTKATGSPTTSNRDYRFKIYEPYGFSFPHQLAKALKQEFTNVSHVKAVFFLLIKFYGYDANGKIIQGSDIPGTSPNNIDPQSLFERGFAITIKDFNWKLEDKMVVYDISAIDHAVQVAFGTQKGIINGNKTIKGATVEEILAGSSANKEVKGLVNILNDDETAELCKKNPKKEVADEFSIQFLDDKIRNAWMMPEFTNKEKTAPILINNIDSVNERTAFLSEVAVIQKKIRTYTIPSGQSIVKVIDNMVSQSTYIKEALLSIDKEQLQPKNPNNDDTNVPNSNPTILSWYNIAPHVTLLNTGHGIDGRDSITNEYAHRITYIINKYEIPYIRSLYSSKTLTYYGPHKRYKYWYTGQNTEVLSYEVNLKRTFLNDLAKTSDSKINTAGQTDVGTASKSGQNADTTAAMPGSDDPAGSIKSWLYAPGDLQNFKMKIIGDPDYLVPSYTIEDIRTNQKFYGPDLTMDPSSGQVFIEIDFLQVSDYDEKTGLLNPNSDIFYMRYPDDLQKKIKGMVYQLKEVHSTFSKGKFEQELTGIIPEFGTVGGQSGQASNRNTDQSNAETNRLLTHKEVKTKPSVAKKADINSSDSLANASRKNIAAQNKLNEKTKVVDDDAARETSSLANRYKDNTPATLNRMMQNTIDRENGVKPDVNNKGEPIARVRSLREILGF